MSGWKFSVTIPSWTQASLEGDEVVVVSHIKAIVEAAEGKTPSQRLCGQLHMQITAGKGTR